MLVELHNGEETIILDKGLSDFYFDNNKILDKIFLKWFLDYYNYETELVDKYKIKIMDNDINFVELMDNDYIIINNNGFIKNSEQETENNLEYETDI